MRGPHLSARQPPGKQHMVKPIDLCQRAVPADWMCAVAIARVLCRRSVLIGISLGVSESPCTIRPLAAALVFHQCFEGFALGGSLVDADYNLCDPAPRA